MAARRAHNPKVVGSNPTPATKELSVEVENMARIIQVRKADPPWLKPFCKVLLFGTLGAGFIGLVASFGQDPKREKLTENSLKVSRFTGELRQHVCDC